MSVPGPGGQAGAAPPLPLVVRRARADDAAAVLAFASGTWDGWDYIPRVWDAWLTAADGVLLVATAGPGDPGRSEADLPPLDRPIALVRVAMLSPTEAWLEGLRVEPAVRLRGVATTLAAASLAWARTQGATVARWATGEGNEGSHRLAATHGLEQLRPRRGYETAAPSEFAGAWDPALVRRSLAAAGLALAPVSQGVTIERWWTRVAADATFVLGERLYEGRSWAWQSLDRELFAAHVRAGEVLVREEEPARWALLILPLESEMGEDERPRAALVAGDGGLGLPLVAEVGRLLERALWIRLPDPDPPFLRGHERAAAEAGLVAGDHPLHLFERTLRPDDVYEVPGGPGTLRFGEEPRRVATAIARPRPRA